MELKHRKSRKSDQNNQVLIVPSGIETSASDKYRVLGRCVLIVPSGIETLQPHVRRFCGRVLIVPSGIETWK